MFALAPVPLAVLRAVADTFLPFGLAGELPDSALINFEKLAATISEPPLGRKPSSSICLIC